MAVPIHSSGSTSYLHATTSLSSLSLRCATKVFVGLKPQSSSPFASSRSNLTADFYDKVSKSLHSRYGGKPTRGRVNMMPIGVPSVPYGDPNDEEWQWVSIWNALYSERVIFIGQRIDEAFSSQIVATMMYLDSIDDSKRLYVYINGPGGDLTPSTAIYDTMQGLRCPVGTHCFGYAYYLTGFLLTAGQKGYRSAMPNSRISLQSPAVAVRGQADAILNEANELARVQHYLYTELARTTGQTVEKISEDINPVKWFTAQEALEYGLIDKIGAAADRETDSPWKDSNAGLG